MGQDRILVVDDEAGIVKMTTNVLIRSGDGYEIQGASDPENALRKIRAWKPNLVLLDLQLGHRMDGQDVCRAIRSDPEIARTAVVVLTAEREEVTEAALFEAGADDYIRKQSFSPTLLVSRVRAVLRRVRPIEVEKEATVPDNALERGPLVMNPVRRETLVKGEVVPLTPTEFHMLYKLAVHSDRVMARGELLDRGSGATAVDRTVDVHILSIRRKLGEHGWLVQTVFRHGYRLATRPPPKTDQAPLPAK